MEKEKISRFDLEAAFKALDEIDIPKVRGIRPNRMDLREAVVRADRTSALIEDYYDLNDPEDVQDASDDRAAEIAKAKLARIEKIVDLDAESEDEIQPSYVGKTIIQCPQCMTLFYKDPADIEPSEDDPSIVNVAEICQHCGNDSGYTLIGKVAEETPEEAAAEAPVEEPAESEEESSEEVPEEETKEENTEENSEEELNLEPIEIPEEESEEKEETKESLNASEFQKDSAKKSELASENTSKNLTLNEAIFGKAPTEWDVFEYFLKEWTDCEVDRSDLEDAFKKGLNGENLGDYLSTFYVGDEADYIDSIYKAGKNIFKNGLAAEIKDIKDCYESLTEDSELDKLNANLLDRSILDNLVSTLDQAAKTKQNVLITKYPLRKSVVATIYDWAATSDYKLVTISATDPLLQDMLIGKNLELADKINKSNRAVLAITNYEGLDSKTRAALFNVISQKKLLDGTELPNLGFSIIMVPEQEKTVDFSASEASRFAFKLDLSKKDESLTERVSTYAKRPTYKYKVYGTDNNANVLEEVEGEFKVDEVKKIKADMKAVMDKNPAVEHVFAEKIDEKGKEIPLDHLTISRHGIDYYALDDEDVDEAFDEDAVEPDAAEVEEGLGSAVTGVVDGIASGIKSLFASNEAEKEDNKTPIVEAESNFGTLSKTDIDKLFNSKEFKTPISASETDAYLAQESLNSKKAKYYEDLEFDEKSFNKAITEALHTKDSFEATSCYISPDGKKIIVEGFVTNNTTCVSKKTTFKFKFYDKQKVFYGLNENFKHLLALKVKLANNNLLTESIK